MATSACSTRAHGCLGSTTSKIQELLQKCLSSSITHRAQSETICFSRKTLSSRKERVKARPVVVCVMKCWQVCLLRWRERGLAVSVDVRPAVLAVSMSRSALPLRPTKSLWHAQQVPSKPKSRGREEVHWNGALARSTVGTIMRACERLKQCLVSTRRTLSGFTAVNRSELRR